jgi:HD superfamily phosphodiesterase
MVKLQEEQRLVHEDFWELRIGIHTGPVISGRVGRNKANPDIWGDTVNIASRMESSGVAGEINITGNTHQLVKDFYRCEYRGKMPIKYKGEIDMYFIRSIAPELSIDGKGKEPNALFGIRLQHVRFYDLEEAVLDRLSKDLPQNIYYHNYKHTLDVVTQVEIIARGEGVNEEELLLLKTAALMHDTGFLISYDDHESKSIELSKEILTRFQYNPTQIVQVIQLIEVTRPKSKPTNKLQAILKDADLDYLGRLDFINVSENLYKELIEYSGKLSPYEWTKKQYDFFSRHRYHTETARKMRQINKEKQLEKLKVLLEIQLMEQ